MNAGKSVVSAEEWVRQGFRNKFERSEGKKNVLSCKQMVLNLGMT